MFFKTLFVLLISENPWIANSTNIGIIVIPWIQIVIMALSINFFRVCFSKSLLNIHSCPIFVVFHSIYFFDKNAILWNIYF